MTETAVVERAEPWREPIKEEEFVGWLDSWLKTTAENAVADAQIRAIEERLKEWGKRPAEHWRDPLHKAYLDDVPWLLAQLRAARQQNGGA